MNPSNIPHSISSFGDEQLPSYPISSTDNGRVYEGNSNISAIRYSIPPLAGPSQQHLPSLSPTTPITSRRLLLDGYQPQHLDPHTPDDHQFDGRCSSSSSHANASTWSSRFNSPFLPSSYQDASSSADTTIPRQSIDYNAPQLAGPGGELSASHYTAPNWSLPPLPNLESINDSSHETGRASSSAGYNNSGSSQLRIPVLLSPASPYTTVQPQSFEPQLYDASDNAGGLQTEEARRRLSLLPPLNITNPPSRRPWPDEVATTSMPNPLMMPTPHHQRTVPLDSFSEAERSTQAPRYYTPVIPTSYATYSPSCVDPSNLQTNYDSAKAAHYTSPTSTTTNTAVPDYAYTTNLAPTLASPASHIPDHTFPLPPSSLAAAGGPSSSHVLNPSSSSAPAPAVTTRRVSPRLREKSKPSAKRKIISQTPSKPSTSAHPDSDKGKQKANDDLEDISDGGSEAGPSKRPRTVTAQEFVRKKGRDKTYQSSRRGVETRLRNEMFELANIKTGTLLEKIEALHTFVKRCAQAQCHQSVVSELTTAHERIKELEREFASSHQKETQLRALYDKEFGKVKTLHTETDKSQHTSQELS